MLRRTEVSQQMSQLGHERHFTVKPRTSVSPSIADISLRCVSCRDPSANSATERGGHTGDVVDADSRTGCGANTTVYLPLPGWNETAESR